MTKKKTPTKRTLTTNRVTKYARDVLSGKIVAGPHVRNSCQRHLQDIKTGKERGLKFDLKAAQHVWGFFEDLLRLSEGQFDDKPFKLDLSQAFILGSIYGWKKSDGTRRYRRAYVEMGKGNGKSPLAGGMGLYALTSDGEASAQVYAAGAKKDQAGILFQDACKMVRKSPALTKRLQFSGGMGREFNIAYHRKSSFFRPISKDAGKTGSGPRPHLALCDEVHEHPDRLVMEMLERGFKFRLQPLLAMFTNSGSDRNSICWEEHEHAVRCAAGTRTPDEDFTYVGEVIDDETFSYVCALDKDDDPLTDDSCWMKANPLLGVILSKEYLAGVVVQAKNMPGKLNGILRLHFCTWTDSSEGWISRKILEAVLHKFDPKEVHAGSELFMGCDLSGSKDMTALAFVVPTGMVERKGKDGAIVMKPTFDAWVEAWTPGDTLEDRAKSDGAPYEVWVRDGWLNAPPGKMIRKDFVAARIAEANSDYLVSLLAYDRYAYHELETELSYQNVEIPQQSHPQGGKVRAKPREEDLIAAKRSGQPKPLGLWMPGSVEMLEELIFEERLRLRRSPVLISACMSAALESDTNQNRWFSKLKATNRIDALVALAMAVGAATQVRLSSSKLDYSPGGMFG